MSGRKALPDRSRNGANVGVKIATNAIGRGRSVETKNNIFRVSADREIDAKFFFQRESAGVFQISLYQLRLLYLNPIKIRRI